MANKPKVKPMEVVMTTAAAGIATMQRWIGLILLVLAFPAQAGQPNQDYAAAIRDASVALPTEVVHNLVAITPDNPNLVWSADHTKLLVVAWKSQSSYDSFYKGQTATAPSEAYVTWVTAAPQVQRFCQAFTQSHPQATLADLNLRLKQYLGLDPSWSYDLFIEMWVDPAQMFRPCVDPEIDDATCNLTFGKTVPSVPGIHDYAAFFNNLYTTDYRTASGPPWTGLGYTFDWGNPKFEEGGSEFILVPGAGFEIKRTVGTGDYCGSGGGQ